MAKSQANPFDLETSNVGQLISYLQIYPADEPLHELNHDFLRVLSRKLRSTLEKSSSELNKAKIHAIEQVHIDDELQRYSECWRNDPAEFWDLSLEALPKYSDLRETNERLRVFLRGAIKLDTQLKIRRVHYRFVTIAAYKHFRRVHPTGKVTEDKVRSYSKDLDLALEKNELRRLTEILCGGQKRRVFCQSLQTAAKKASASRKAAANDELSNTEVEEEVDYAPMFVDEIPDTIWHNKNGLYGNQLTDSVSHLLAVMANWSAKPRYKTLATTLLAFHDHLIWHDELGSVSHNGKRHSKPLEKETSKKRQRSAPSSTTGSRTASSQPSVENSSEGQLYTTTPHRPDHSRWNCLLSVAKSQTAHMGDTEQDALQPRIVPANSGLTSWSQAQAKASLGNKEFPSWTALHTEELWECNASSEPRLGPPSSTMSSITDVSSKYPARNANVNNHADAATQQGGIPINCEQLSLSNVLNSGCLETLWPHSASTSATEALLTGSESVPSEHEILPYLTSNDLDIFWHDNANIAPVYS